MAPAYLFKAPSGIPGDITRVDESNVEPIMLKTNGSPATYPQVFGFPLVYASGGAAKWITSSVAADFAGVLVREVPQIAGSSASDASFDGTLPNPLYPNGMCVRGYVSVKCVTGTPARGGIVYIRTVAATGKAIGDFEATNDSGNNLALSTTQATWASDGKDADNNAELRIAR